MSFEIPKDALGMLCVCLGVSIILASVAVPIAWYHIAIDTAAMKAGLVQGYVPYTSTSTGTSLMWIKPNAEAPKP